jgi:pilus assembly protein Flp/PilA
MRNHAFVTPSRENFSGRIEDSAIACWDSPLWSGSCARLTAWLRKSRAFADAGALERSENLMTRVQDFLRNESGVTAIEYALIASLIAVFIIVAVQYVGTQVSTVFTEVGNSLK